MKWHLFCFFCAFWGALRLIPLAYAFVSFSLGQDFGHRKTHEMKEGKRHLGMAAALWAPVFLGFG